jgi:C1A family cysteine protease
VSDNERRGMGWRPELPDQRDIKFGFRAVTIPDKLDLRTNVCMPPIVDQGQLGSCTANAATACYEFEAQKQGEPPSARSRLFIYYNERAIEGTIQWDAGAYIRDAFKTMNKEGAPPETLWPYTISKFARRPTQKSYQSGLARQALLYQTVPQDATAIMAAVALNQLVEIGFTVYSSFFDIGPDGMMKMPALSEQVQGGHAVCVVGFDQTARVWIIRNSWGTGWGDHGYFYMPFEYLLTPSLSTDFWLCSLVEK